MWVTVGCRSHLPGHLLRVTQQVQRLCEVDAVVEDVHRVAVHRSGRAERSGSAGAATSLAPLPERIQRNDERNGLHDRGGTLDVAGRLNRAYAGSALSLTLARRAASMASRASSTLGIACSG